MGLKIEYDYYLLDEVTSNKATLVANIIEDTFFDKLPRIIQSSIELRIREKITNYESTIIVNRTIENRNKAAIDIFVNKSLYEENPKNQVVASMLGIIRIVDELRPAESNEKYSVLEEEILKYFDLNKEDIHINSEIVQICQLIARLRKIYRNYSGALYEFKTISKEDEFIKYKNNDLFIYLYEYLIGDFSITCKTAKENLKAFGLYKKFNIKEKYKYYYIYICLDYYYQSLPLIRTKWFYVRKAFLLIPLYIAMQTGQIIYPVLASLVILVIFYTDYLVGKNEGEYYLVCEQIKFFLYFVLSMIVLFHYIITTPPRDIDPSIKKNIEVSKI